MTSIQAELAGYAVSQIRSDGDRFEIDLAKPGAEPMVLSVGISPMDPTRITGLAVDSG